MSDKLGLQAWHVNAPTMPRLVRVLCRLGSRQWLKHVYADKGKQANSSFRCFSLQQCAATWSRSLRSLAVLCLCVCPSSCLLPAASCTTSHHPTCICEYQLLSLNCERP